MSLDIKIGAAMDRKLKITFVLPGPGVIPSGGYKVVYEYANHLSRKGHAVVVVHSSRRCMVTWKPLDHLKNAIRWIQQLMNKSYRPDKWFRVDPEVKLLCVPDLSERWIPNGDVVIATAWRTAEWVSRYSRAKGIGYYLIQHHEIWDGDAKEVNASWKLPLKKIVIAQWLQAIALGMGENATYIPNGLSINEFQLDIPLSARDPKRVMMLYHDAIWKGSADGVKAISLARHEEPGIRFVLYGVSPRPAALPEWMEYYQKPERKLLRELYNQAAVFVAPSWSEGWGLPPCEAMLCGAAVAATDADGYREFAIHEDTALLSPVQDPRRLADNILRLVRDSALRAHIASRGHEHIQQFTWERASSRLESLLCEH
jgi:glycosyltransferase involved in cell wall biosynthesis